jgi:hypothetical protein
MGVVVWRIQNIRSAVVGLEKSKLKLCMQMFLVGMTGV